MPVLEFQLEVGKPHPGLLFLVLVGSRFFLDLDSGHDRMCHQGYFAWVYRGANIGSCLPLGAYSSSTSGGATPVTEREQREHVTPPPTHVPTFGSKRS